VFTRQSLVLVLFNLIVFVCEVTSIKCNLFGVVTSKFGLYNLHSTIGFLYFMLLMLFVCQEKRVCIYMFGGNMSHAK
jgi:uncharacterized membrane protein